MFWKKDRDEVEVLKKDNEKAGRDREAARLNFMRSLQQVRKHLELPLDALAGDLAGPRKEKP